MSVRMGYANPTDRVAAACIAAVKPWRAKNDSALDELGALAAPALRLTNLVVRLIRQTANQGLSPGDLDSADGTAALAAIADAIFSGKKKTALRAALPVEWKYVANAAERIIDRTEGPKRRP